MMLCLVLLVMPVDNYYRLRALVTTDMAMPLLNDIIITVCALCGDMRI